MNILLAESSMLLRDGLKCLLKVSGSSAQILEAVDMNQARRILGAQRIDFLMINLRMLGRAIHEGIAKFKQEYPELRIVVITDSAGKELLQRLSSEAIDGVVGSQNGFNAVRQVLEKIAAVRGGKTERALTDIDFVLQEPSGDSIIKLSVKEIELMRAIAMGLTSKEIAEKLHMAVSTAQTGRVRLIRKTKTLNTAGLIAFAHKNGFI